MKPMVPTKETAVDASKRNARQHFEPQPRDGNAEARRPVVAHGQCGQHPVALSADRAG